MLSASHLISPTLPTTNDQMNGAPNADFVECDACEKGVVERRVDDWSPDCGAGYEYLNGCKQIRVPHDGVPNGVPIELCAACAADDDAKAASLADTMMIAHQVLEAREKIEELKQASMFGDALVYRTIGQAMMSAGATKQVIDDIEFRIYPPEDEEYCTCHHSRSAYCATPHHERTVYVRNGVPKLWMKRVAKKSVAA